MQKLREQEAINKNKNIQNDFNLRPFDSNMTPTEEEQMSSLINSKSGSDSSEEDDNILIIDSSTDSPKKKNTINDFETTFVLGKGSYGKVVLAKNIYTNKYYALKIIDKIFLAKQEKEYEVHIEKLIISNLNHKNILKLYSTFQDSKKLYFILEYCPNGDLSDLIRTQGKLSLDLAIYYTAEIISALEYMHRKGIYHRDLKAENILLDEKMHLKICDFGTASIKGMFFDKRNKRFVKIEEHIKQSKDEEIFHSHNSELVGTPEYVSPEVLKGDANKIGPPVDLWALGCILFFALHGRTPFKDKNNSLIFEKIMKLDYTINDDIDPHARDLIIKLLSINPFDRPGAGEKGTDNDFRLLKSHPLFDKINWEKLCDTLPPIDISKVQLTHHKIINKDKTEYSMSPPLSRSKLNNQEILLESRINKKNYSVDNHLSAFRKMSWDYEGENKKSLILEAIAQKKSPWFHYNTRLIHLHSEGKIEYFEPDDNNLKGTIILDKDCKAVLVDDYKFDVVTKIRKYSFKLPNKTAKNWIDKINEIVQNL